MTKTFQEHAMIDMKSAFLYGTIKEEVYVCQPLGFKDLQFLDTVYKVEKALYGLHQAPRAWYETLSTYLLENRFRRGIIDKTLFIKKDKGDILLVQTASTPIETNKALLKDKEAEDVDVHLYRSMFGSLMYLIASRPDIMFVICACARDSPFNLEAFSDSYYAGSSLDMKSTIGGCQFLRKRLISWQCKKQTVVANSTTKADVEAARRMSLSAEVRMRAEYNIKENRRLKSAVAEAIHLRVEASNFVTVEKSFRYEVNTVNEHNNILEKERDALDLKVADLEALRVTKEREMTDLNAQLTSIKSHNDSLVDQVHELEVTSFRHQENLSNYENLTERLEEFQDAQLKGMQDGLSAKITHGTKGRVLKDVAAYNPSTEADYISALQHLQNVDFPLLAEFGSNKDANVDALMNILHLEETLAKRLDLTESQLHVDQLMVPIHHLPDQVAVGASALSLALDVSSSRVRKIKENIVNHRSALCDVFVPLVEPLSATALTGMKCTSNVISATTDTTMALSTTLASASIVAPIYVDDYEVAGMDDQAGADGNADPFPNVDDAELDIPL
nr:hypothetical protein [Tanacetum cinerariifolium]